MPLEKCMHVFVSETGMFVYIIVLFHPTNFTVFYKFVYSISMLTASHNIFLYTPLNAWCIFVTLQWKYPYCQLKKGHVLREITACLGSYHIWWPNNEHDIVCLQHLNDDYVYGVHMHACIRGVDNFWEVGSWTSQVSGHAYFMTLCVHKMHSSIPKNWFIQWTSCRT